MPLTTQDQALWLAVRDKNLKSVLKPFDEGANVHSLDPDTGDYDGATLKDSLHKAE